MLRNWPLPPDRPWWTVVIYIAAVALFLRFYDLPLKPLHHDEAVNTVFLTKLVNPPHLYRYDPSNYHGPTLYYVGWLSAAVFGLSTFAIRFVTAAFGLITVLLVLALKRYIGAVGALAAAALIALSPGAVYFSRYFIHEMLLVCFTMALVVSAALWVSRRRLLFLYLASVSAGLMFATKETAIITAVVIAVAALGATWYVELRKLARSTDSPSSLPKRFLIAAAGRSALSIGQDGKRRLVLLIPAVALFLAASLFFYTSLFTHWQGALDALGAFAIWTKTGTAVHTRPWHAYLNWLSQEELPLLLLGAAGTGLALVKAENRFTVFAALWSVGILMAYSVIPYKTPWLALNAIVPLAITGGYAAEIAWRHRPVVSTRALTVVAAVVAGVGLYQAVVLNFIRYDDGRYPYVYVHTQREVMAMVDEIDRLRTYNPALTIAITSKDQFPLSWYLRSYRAGYHGRPVATNDSLVIASEEQQPVLDRLLGDRYARLRSYRLRPGVRLVLYARRDLKGVTLPIDDRASKQGSVREK
jgi:uncharacterized protein (TIGR03663 family)